MNNARNNDIATKAAKLAYMALERSKPTGVCILCGSALKSHDPGYSLCPLSHMGDEIDALLRSVGSAPFTHGDKVKLTLRDDGVVYNVTECKYNPTYMSKWSVHIEPLRWIGGWWIPDMDTMWDSEYIEKADETVTV